MPIFAPLFSEGFGLPIKVFIYFNFNKDTNKI